MMSNGTNERLKIYTQHVPLRQNTEEKVRGKELKVVWDDVNEWNTEVVWKAEMKGLVVDTTGHLYDEFIRLLFLHTHREESVLTNELPE